jgi:hypothetical protein
MKFWTDLWRGIYSLLLSQLTKAQLNAPAGAKVVTKLMTLNSGFDAVAAEMIQRMKIVEYMRALVAGRVHYKYGAEIAQHQRVVTESDCSEAVEAAYREAGVPGMPDGAIYQKAVCQRVRSPKPGDLLFLGPNANGIPHVMISSGAGTVLHVVKERGAVEDPHGMWLTHQRSLGWFRFIGFLRPPEDRA